MRCCNNITLAIILVSQVLISAALAYWDSGNSKPAIDTDLFVIEDIDPVDRVVITRGEEEIDCRAFAGGFMINDQYPMDQNLLTVLAAVLQQVRVVRPLSAQEQQEVRTKIFQTGSQVQVYQGNNLLLSFWSGGDRSKQNSYFVSEDGTVYLVHLPGYTSYVNGLFELPLSKWRSRNIFFNTWRSLLSYSYQDFTQPANDFQIRYKDPFFAVPGVQQLDSNKVMNYIRDLVSLKAKSIVVDTAYQGMPWLELTTTDIDPARNQNLILYGNQAQSSVLGKTGDQYFTFHTADLEPLLKSSGYFRYLESE